MDSWIGGGPPGIKYLIGGMGVTGGTLTTTKYSAFQKQRVVSALLFELTQNFLKASLCSHWPEIQVVHSIHLLLGSCVCVYTRVLRQCCLHSTFYANTYYCGQVSVLKCDCINGSTLSAEWLAGRAQCSTGSESELPQPHLSLRLGAGRRAAVTHHCCWDSSLGNLRARLGEGGRSSSPLPLAVWRTSSSSNWGENTVMSAGAPNSASFKETVPGEPYLSVLHWITHRADLELWHTSKSSLRSQELRLA